MFGRVGQSDCPVDVRDALGAGPPFGHGPPVHDQLVQPSGRYPVERPDGHPAAEQRRWLSPAPGHATDSPPVGPARLKDENTDFWRDRAFPPSTTDATI